MKILNLYAGIGGNRKLWGDEHEITAVENVDYIADVYAHFYPQDTLVRADAHQYLLDHHNEFDFIWSSPPCPSHSKLNNALNPQGYIRYPDMSLYQEIIFLKKWHKGKWIVENVEPYYMPLMQPRVVIDRHCIWSNFAIPTYKTARTLDVSRAEHVELAAYFGVVFPEWVARGNKRKMLRNIADSGMGAHILKAAMREVKQEAML